jgi:hypothetical protein
MLSISTLLEARHFQGRMQGVPLQPCWKQGISEAGYKAAKRAERAVSTLLEARHFQGCMQGVPLQLCLKLSISKAACSARRACHFNLA